VLTPVFSQVQFDKLKRKALFGPVAGGNEHGQTSKNQYLDEQKTRHQRGNMVGNVTVNTVVGGMEANGVGSAQPNTCL
jgi:hypothetical protein